jgi:biotin-(acetyl-CoA carboxylase) ligase
VSIPHLYRVRSTSSRRNPRLLSRIPTPIVSLASHQLSGRGRGGNVWISPSGSLAFSVLLRAPLSLLPASKLVFVQYLFALAVVEACREPNVLGERGNCTRLKWPNDIYAVVGPGAGDRNKIGGILVTTSFSSGSVDIIVGMPYRSAKITWMSLMEDYRMWSERTQRSTSDLTHAASASWRTKHYHFGRHRSNHNRKI